MSEDGESEAPAVKPLNIAVVGRPNVGKSSLVNALLGEERVMVSDVAGTTRDAIDVDFTLRYQGGDRAAVLVDTAGLRKKAKVDTVVEFFSVMRAQAAIDRADLVLFVVEASPDGMTAQDRRIASMIQKAGKAPVVGAAPLKLYYASMVGMTPPKVLLFVNNPKYCADNYLAFLKNTLRQAFDLTGVPLELELRARPKKVESIRREPSPAARRRMKAGKPAPKRDAEKPKRRVKPNSKRRNNSSGRKG